MNTEYGMQTGCCTYLAVEKADAKRAACCKRRAAAPESSITDISWPLRSVVLAAALPFAPHILPTESDEYRQITTEAASAAGWRLAPR